MKIEGRNAVLEAVKSGKTIDRVLVRNGMRDEPSRALVSTIKAAGIKVHFVDKITIDNESTSGKNQGFIAFVTEYKYVDVQDILSSPKGKDPFIVILDGIEDIALHRFTEKDVVRHRLVQKIILAYEKYDREKAEHRAKDKKYHYRKRED